MIREFIDVGAFSFLALFPILNPPAMAPIFVEMTAGLPERDRMRMAAQVSRYTFVMLIVVLVTGGWLLKIFGISIPVIRVAGGLLLFNTAWRMLNDEPRLSPAEQKHLKGKMSDRAFFPLTMPITAGPGSIAVTLTLVPAGPLMEFETWLRFGGIAFGITCAAITVFIFYRYSGAILGRMGQTGIQAISKLSAFILLAIGVEIVWQGIQGLIKG